MSTIVTPSIINNNPGLIVFNRVTRLGGQQDVAIDLIDFVPPDSSPVDVIIYLEMVTPNLFKFVNNTGSGTPAISFEFNKVKAKDNVQVTFESMILSFPQNDGIPDMIIRIIVRDKLSTNDGDKRRTRIICKCK